VTGSIFPGPRCPWGLRKHMPVSCKPILARAQGELRSRFPRHRENRTNIGKDLSSNLFVKWRIFLRIGGVDRTDGPDFCADCLLKLLCLILIWWFDGLLGVQPRNTVQGRNQCSIPLRVKLLRGNDPFCFAMVYQLQLPGEEVSVLETELPRKTICSSVSSPCGAEHASG